MKKINRREFLKRSASAAAVSSAFAHVPGMAWSQGMGTSAPFPDYKALVCVFMFGGNDSYNMVVPRSNAEYAVYANSRQNMAVAQQDLLPINPLTSDGVDYGLHPSMGSIQTLFEQNRAAFINNVGPLVEPTTKNDFFSQSVLLPPQLFSHNDQQDQWQLVFLLRLVHQGMNLQEAIDGPLFHSQHPQASFYPRGCTPGGLMIEPNFPRATLDALRARGHLVTEAAPWSIGRLTATSRSPAGLLKAAATPRLMQAYAAGR